MIMFYKPENVGKCSFQVSLLVYLIKVDIDRNRRFISPPPSFLYCILIHWLCAFACLWHDGVSFLAFNLDHKMFKRLLSYWKADFYRCENCEINLNCRGTWNYENLKAMCEQMQACTVNVSRGESIILLCPQVIRVQVEHADHECQKDQDEDDHELEDILDSPP